MAAFNFPNSPSTNDIHNENGVSFKWNGTVWKKIGTVANTFDQINVTGVSTSVQVNATTLNVTGVATFGTSTKYADGVQALFGNNNDFIIRHSGSAHEIIGGVSGSLHIRAPETHILNNAGNEYMIKTVSNGAVELYYDASKKFETRSGGVTVTGGLNLSGELLNNDHIQIQADNKHLIIGAGDDLRAFHNGTNSIVKNDTGKLIVQADDIWFKDKDDGDVHAKFIHDGAVELYYDNSLKLDTSGTGPRVYGNLRMEGDNRKVILGAGSDLQLYHDGTQNFIEGTAPLYIKGSPIVLYKGGSTEKYFEGVADGTVKLYYDGSKKIETTSTGISVTGLTQTDGLEVQDDGYGGTTCLIKTDDEAPWAFQIRNDTYNAGSCGFKVYQANSGTVTQQIRGNSAYVDYWITQSNGSTGRNMIKVSSGGAIELHYQSLKKLETTSTGIEVTGKVRINGGSTARSIDVVTTHGSGGEIASFQNSDSGNYGGLVVSGGETDRECRLESAFGSSYMTFYTQTASAAGERMRITDDGQIKILGQSGYDGFYLSNAYGQAGIFGGMYYNGSSWVRAAAGSRVPAGMYVNTGGHIVLLSASENSGTSATVTEKIRMSNNGDLLIGTTTDRGGKLEVFDGPLVLSKTGSGTKNWRFVNNNIASGNLGVQVSTATDGTTYANRIEIAANGQTCIGNPAVAPTHRLSVLNNDSSSQDCAPLQVANVATATRATACINFAPSATVNSVRAGGWAVSSGKGDFFVATKDGSNWREHFRVTNAGKIVMPNNTDQGTSYENNWDGSHGQNTFQSFINYKHYVGYNQYCWYKWTAYGGSSSRPQAMDIKCMWSTGHASGSAYGHYAIRTRTAHTHSRVDIYRTIRYELSNSGGSYYGWTSTPELMAYNCNGTGNNAGIYLRVQGHGSHNGGTFDMNTVQSFHILVFDNQFQDLNHGKFEFVGNSTPSDVGSGPSWSAPSH